MSSRSPPWWPPAQPHSQGFRSPSLASAGPRGDSAWWPPGLGAGAAGLSHLPPLPLTPEPQEIAPGPAWSQRGDGAVGTRPGAECVTFGKLPASLSFVFLDNRAFEAPASQVGPEGQV